ncbi:MAG: VanZ family protein, partial [Vicinamibacteria bacterium]|nr:VanZ family protein [Vicinamibacteria bacterium]
YGVSDEWHQSFVPGRDATVGDVMKDALGSLCALILWQRVAQRSSAADR